MGNYAYEFDMFSGAHQPFTPFYSMIEDTVRTAVKLKQISLIPEVSLSPRNGPDEEVSSCQNRLAEYIYAQMMWDPQQNAYDLIREWCDLAYGKAAKPMYEYFTMLDKQWDSMDLHFKILGRALNVAPCLITPEIRKKAETLLQEADKLLDGKMNPALEFEKKLFRQWLAFLNDPDTLAIPKFEKADAAASSNVRFPIGGENAPSVAWTRKALIVNH